MSTELPPDERGQRPWNQYASPLRYPGGKRRLAGFVKLLMERNDLVGGEYAEPYAGGAAIGLELLYEEYAERIYINDIDPTLHAFWLAARDETEALCRRVRAAVLSIEEWRSQRATFLANQPDPIDLAFATLYLNRTNRSGILTGGPIGGIEQAGTWRIDARFRREDLVRRLEKIGRNSSRIEVSGLDAIAFLKDVASGLSERSLLYLDPPYYHKGRENLYVNSYEPSDHAAVAAAIGAAARPWFVTYDDTPEIRALYETRQHLAYDIRYTARKRYQGKEVAFFADGLVVPPAATPALFDGTSRRPAVTAVAG